MLGATLYYIGASPLMRQATLACGSTSRGCTTLTLAMAFLGKERFMFYEYSGEILWEQKDMLPNYISLAAFLFQNNFPWHLGLYGGLLMRILHFLRV